MSGLIASAAGPARDQRRGHYGKTAQARRVREQGVIRAVNKLAAALSPRLSSSSGWSADERWSPRNNPRSREGLKRRF